MRRVAVARGETPEQTERRNAFIELAARGKFAGITEALMPQLIHPSRLGDVALTEAIKCPTLVLCGRQDQLTPLDRHEEMAAGIQGSRLEVVDECGHMSTMEKSDQVNRALRQWLAGS